MLNSLMVMKKYNVWNLEWVKNTIKQPKSDEDKKARKKRIQCKIYGRV